MSDPQKPSDPYDPAASGPPSVPQPPSYGAYPGAGQQAPSGDAAPGSAPQPAYGAPQSTPPGGYGAPLAPYGQPGQPGQPYAPYGGAPSSSPAGGNGLAIASVVLGGVGLLLSIIVFGGILGLVGLALGIVALLKKTGSRLLAIIGTALSGLAVLISVAVLVVGLVAAGSVRDSIDESYGETGGSSSPDVAEPSEPTDDASEEASSENAVFGDVWSYDDGISVSVSAPQPFTPSETAAGADQAAAVVFTVTVQNDTGANYDPIEAYSSVSSAGVEASQVFDSAQGLMGSPSTAVPAGQSATWQEVYSVSDPAQLVYQIAPGYDYDAAIFTN
ncbi:hypothetical protein ABID92_001431 [Frigoribacterium sp. PvP120]|uniref:DUF4190 domain-containing protein n=1 Tax=unclassified Frigoribacterium TaxID=2627005 RepID=UPI001AE8DF34|nr:DUF4190 domain-containing protein [Frigoribacterium sp. PvP121]MBP1242673.1 hypothetical protein [Frigoribacterium sp. PvP121]